MYICLNYFVIIIIVSYFNIINNFIILKKDDQECLTMFTSSSTCLKYHKFYLNFNFQ